MIEIELKFRVKDIESLFKKLNGVKPKILYVKDQIFGYKNTKSKIRKRTVYNNNKVKYIFEKTTPIKEESIKKVIEEKCYKIPSRWICENSYDKIRYEFKRDNIVIAVDFYSIGCFIELEGNEKDIKKYAKKLGFSLKDNIVENIDTVFCNNYKNKSKAPLHWGFEK